MAFLTPHHTGHVTLGGLLADTSRLLGGHLASPCSPCHVVRDGNSANPGNNSANWGRGEWLG